MYSGERSEVGRVPKRQGLGSHLSRAAAPDTAAKYRCYRCPHCGEQVESIRGRGPGAPKKAFYAANGETKHLNDWSALLGVTVPALAYYLKKKWTMQQVYDRLTDPEYKKPGPAQGHRWGKAVKMEER